MKKIPLILPILIILIALGTGSVFFFLNTKKDPQPQMSPLQKEFSNGQPYATFQTDRFEVNYPDWPKIDLDETPDADKLKVAVSNEGCNVFVKEKDLPEGMTLESYTEKVIKDFGDEIAVNVSEVKDGRASLDADIGMGNGAIVQNVSRVYQVGNTLYSVAFISGKVIFADVCGPIVEEVIASVRITQ